MSERDLQIGRLRRIGEEPPVCRDGFLVLAETHARGRVKGEMAGVAGLEPQQRLEFRARPQVLLPAEQRAGVVMAGGRVIRRPLQHGLQQRLRLVERAAFDSDPGQQPQRLDVLAAPKPVGPHDALRECQLAVREQAAGLHDLGRQLPEDGEVAGRRCRLRRVPRQAI
jgi:hypothetical protein